MVGCSSNSTIAYTYSVDTGDSIKVTLDTSEGYGMTSELPFIISKDDQTLSQGTFITAEGYDQYVEYINSDEMSTLLDSGEKDGNKYIFWNYDDSEYNYAVLVTGSSSGLIIGNIESVESAKECFSRLTFSIE